MKKFICTVCGYEHIGEEAPATCPLCKAPESKFNDAGEVDENLVSIEDLL